MPINILLRRKMKVCSGGERACRLHVRLQADPERALIYFLEADHVRIVAQNLLHDERPPILGCKPPAWDGYVSGSADQVALQELHNLATHQQTILMRLSRVNDTFPPLRQSQHFS